MSDHTESDNEEIPPPKSCRVDGQVQAHRRVGPLFPRPVTAGTMQSATTSGLNRCIRLTSLYDKMGGLFTQFVQEKTSFKAEASSSDPLWSKYKRMQNAHQAWQAIPSSDAIPARTAIPTISNVDGDSSDEDEPLAQRLATRLSQPRVRLNPPSSFTPAELKEREESKKRKAMEVEKQKSESYADFLIESKKDEKYAKVIRGVQYSIKQNSTDLSGLMRNFAKALEFNVTPKDVFKVKKRRNNNLGAAQSKLPLPTCYSAKSSRGQRLGFLLNHYDKLQDKHAFEKAAILHHANIEYQMMILEGQVQEAKIYKENMKGGGKILLGGNLGKMAWSLSQDTLFGLVLLIMMDWTPNKINELCLDDKVGFGQLFDASQRDKMGDLPSHYRSALASYQDEVIPFLQDTFIHHLRHKYDELDPILKRYFRPLTGNSDNFTITIYDRDTDELICETQMVDIHIICGLKVPEKKTEKNTVKLHRTMTTKAYPIKPAAKTTALTFSQAHHLQQLTLTDTKAMELYAETEADWFPMLNQPSLMKEAGVEGKLNPQFAFWAGCARSDKIKDAIADCYTASACKDDSIDKALHASSDVDLISISDIKNERTHDLRAR